MAKQRSDTHLQEASSEDIVRSHIPEEWCIRKLHPDYGVDLSIEVFERKNDGIPTMGEFLYIQLKSTKKLRRKSVTLRERLNVEKFPLSHRSITGSSDERYELDVVSYSIDIDTLDNARLMSASTPLMLFLVDSIQKDVYFICLTDYYEKILLPKNLDFSTRSSVTIYIPVSNRLSDSTIDFLRLYASRAKLYSMFNICKYQYNEMNSLQYHFIETFNERELSILEADINIIRRFSQRAASLPIWERAHLWPHLMHARRTLEATILELEKNTIEVIKAEMPNGNIISADHSKLLQHCSYSWKLLANLGNVFEDICREWLIPTILGQLCSDISSGTTFRKIGDGA
ncbi:DUF4365 domain-containing protein [Gluconacetobacter sp.]|uniref:DUF4365 domain-containing protein n=1 Tax=Gluconacetobacter sp. TaxID=1935994 RepID=UPI0039E96CDA